MAKEKKVPLNRLVLPETFREVKRLAGELRCSEGEVVDQAVMLFGSTQNGERDSMAEVYVPPSEVPAAIPAYSDPATIPGVSVGMPTTAAEPGRRETFRERAIREKKEREEGARARSSIGDDPSFSVDPDFVQD